MGFIIGLIGILIGYNLVNLGTFCILPFLCLGTSRLSDCLTSGFPSGCTSSQLIGLVVVAVSIFHIISSSKR